MTGAAWEPPGRKNLGDMENETLALIARLRAALRLIGNQDITPMGARMLERILDEEEAKNRRPA